MSENAIAVVVISYNTRDIIGDCIESVMRELSPGDEFLVVDNSSQDGTVDFVRETYPHVRLISNPHNGGFSYGCNVGIGATRAPLVLLTNGDVRFSAGVLNKMREKMASEPGIGILSPQLMGEDGRVIQMSWGWSLTLFGEMRQKMLSPKHVQQWSIARRIAELLQRRERDVPIVAGACMLARRAMLDKVGRMDESFELYFEDADLCVRCNEAGYKVRFDPKLKVYHKLGQSGRSNPKRITLIYRQSQITYYHKHNSKLELQALKIYLSLKFLKVGFFWTDGDFRRWIFNIIFERAKLRLSNRVPDQFTPTTAPH